MDFSYEAKTGEFIIMAETKATIDRVAIRKVLGLKVVFFLDISLNCYF